MESLKLLKYSKNNKLRILLSCMSVTKNYGKIIAVLILAQHVNGPIRGCTRHGCLNIHLNKME